MIRTGDIRRTFFERKKQWLKKFSLISEFSLAKYPQVTYEFLLKPPHGNITPNFDKIWKFFYRIKIILLELEKFADHFEGEDRKVIRNDTWHSYTTSHKVHLKEIKNFDIIFFMTSSIWSQNMSNFYQICDFTLQSYCYLTIYFKYFLIATVVTRAIYLLIMISSYNQKCLYKKNNIKI